MPNPPTSSEVNLEAALRVLKGQGVPLDQNPDFPPEVNERLLTVQEVAEANFSRVSQLQAGHVHQLAAAAVRAPSSTKKLIWIRKAADTLASATAPHAACKSGCSHCCHIPVAIPKLEARALAKASGRALNEHPHDRDVEIEGYNYPCPFLVDNQCSVYEVRPAICRTYFNLDQDELLCRLVPGGQIPVPTMDNRSVMLALMEIEADPNNWADIRQWLPSS